MDIILTFLKKRMIIASLVSMMLSTVLIVGCSDSTSSSVTSLTVSFKNSAITPGAVVSYKVGAVDNVTLTSASIVISKIEFISAEEDSLNFYSDEPMIVELDLSGVAQEIGTVDAPPGLYVETEFKIDQLTEADSSVYVNNPDFQDISIRIEGYVNGDTDSSFVWVSDLDEEQVHEFEGIDLQEGQQKELIFIFDSSQWFQDELGAFIDPRDEQNFSLIENNIKNAFDIEQEDAL